MNLRIKQLCYKYFSWSQGCKRKGAIRVKKILGSVGYLRLYLDTFTYPNWSFHGMAAVTENPYSMSVIMHLVTGASGEGHNS